MSRYSLKPLPHRADLFEVAVGWDAGLDTYFVLEFGGPDSAREPAIRFRRGTSLRDITSSEGLIGIARTLAEIPDDLAAKLHLDRLSAPHNPNAPISRLISDLLVPPLPARR
jgi:hypothetical protein